jgi:NitT/TauT family transport system substrate-binding protein
MLQENLAMKGRGILWLGGIVLCWFILAAESVPAAGGGKGAANGGAGKPLVVAVEFNTHASAAYVARARGLYEAEGLRIKTFDSYVTGMALAAALTRGDVDAAYICLAPAISAHANGGVALKVVSGTHHYGYAVVADPKKVKTPRDLEKPGMRIGCVREGNAADVFFEKGISRYGLNRSAVMKNVRRMNPPEQILALKTGRLDAAVMPEHYPSIAVAQGYKVVFSARDVWPDMQGSVLAVSDRLLESHPEMVKSLVRVNRLATRWINDHPREAAAIVFDALNVAGQIDGASAVYPAPQARLAGKISLSPEVVLSSITQGVQITADVDPVQVQKTIDTMAELGLIRGRFDARGILKLEWPGI